MDYDRLPRKMLSLCVTMKCPAGASHFTDGLKLKISLHNAGVPLDSWSRLAGNRTEWKDILTNARF